MKIINSLLIASLVLGIINQFSFANSQSNNSQLLSNMPYSSIKTLDKSEPDSIIKYGEDPYQFAELWQPDIVLPNNPAIVMIHGGCWLNAFDISHTHPASHALKQAGFTVWSLEYRRTGDKGGAWPGSYQDILQGIDKALQTLKQDLVIIGHSAGGHLALLAGNHYHKKHQDRIKKIIGLAAISDITRYSKGKNSCQTATPKFMQGRYQDNKTAYDSANPMIQGFHPNTVLIHGSQDNIVPLEQSLNTKQKVKVIENAGHFDMIHPKTKSWQTILTILKN